MLVEDDAAFAQLLCTHFEGAGLSVTVIDRAERVLKLVRQAPHGCCSSISNSPAPWTGGISWPP